MRTITTIKEMRAAIAALRGAEKTIGFVPTMGALHDGHLSLVDLSKKNTDATVVSIFVNPTQFAPGEDFEKYPRNVEDDARMLIDKDVEFLFLPTAKEIYPEGASTSVHVSGITSEFEGAIRPDHFDGVATVVTLLFNIVQPHFAYFGQKDAQQVAVVKRLVKDLHLPIDVVVGETVREEGSLAMSSRNRYLSEEQRGQSQLLSQVLFQIRDSLIKGTSFAFAKSEALGRLSKEAPIAQVDYLDLVDPETFQKIASFEGRDAGTVVLAARFGNTRLLDNILVKRT
ncbi:MAG TPA: pantoate--beta-alanine ligase [Candidatus Kapabacteria bacterium]|nr:pantoate--beta-alanine ligase [Candidatus Kapabacteria bacterium]